MNNTTNTTAKTPIAYCLYRVSTVGQVDKVKDDIPMQREICREFAERQGWIIGKEFLEKGVSGYKVSAAKRDAIQDLKAAALRKEFDILLVFMFDRIGRIDDETPFVVEWFVQQGIRVWSTQEGERRFESHIDKLMNYITFWQASGESAKTSIRIKTRMQQLSAEGMYTGGHVPFGYCKVNNGRLNKKGKEVHDLALEPREAEWVRKLYEKTVHDGWGSYKLAMYLNDNGMRTHTGSKFQAENVIRILRNKMNLGYGRNSEEELPFLPHLQIIDEQTFEQAQEILDQRSRSFDDKRTIARQTKSKNLLSGIMFCGHCGGRLTSMVYREKYIRKKDGSVYDRKQLKYLCYHKSRGLCKCDGQSTYIAAKVDSVVCELIHKMFENIKDTPDEDVVQQRIKKELSSNKALRTKLNTEMTKCGNQLIKLQDEIGLTLTGDSVYTPEQLRNVGYNYIQRMTTDIVVKKEGREIWAGRVLSDGKNFWNNRSLFCEGELAFLNDTTQPPAEYHGITVRGFLETLINVHNGKVAANRRFTVGVVTVTDPNDSLYRYTNNELSVAIVDAIWGTSGVSFIGYILQNSVRAYTASKFGIPKEEGENDGHTDDSGNNPDTGTDDLSDSEPEVQDTRMVKIRCIKGGKGTR